MIVRGFNRPSIRGLVRGITRSKGGFVGLDLDFVQGRYALNGPYRSSPADLPGWSFARTGVGYAETVSGVLVPFASGVPRITDRGLLAEVGRTNIVPNSSLSGWSAQNAVVTDVLGWGPFTTARRIASGGAAWNRAEITFQQITAGTAWAVSVFYRAGSSGRALVNMRNNPAAQETRVAGPVGALAVTSTNQAGSVSNVVNRSYGEDVYSVSFVFTPNATQFYNIGIGPDTTTVGQTVDGLHAQMEFGQFSTTPILTTGSGATRGPDLASLPMALNPTAGITFIAEVDYSRIIPLEDTSIAALTDGSGNAIVGAWRSQNGNAFFQVRTAGVGSAINYGIRNQPGVLRLKMATAFQGGEYRSAQNGLLGTPLFGQDTPILSQVDVGHSFNTRLTNDYIRRVRVLPYAASDAELQALTA